MQKNYLILENDFLWLEDCQHGWRLPKITLPNDCNPASEQWLLTHNDTAFVYIELTNPATPPSTLTRFHLRECATLLEPDTFKAIGKAKQLHAWQQTHLFCGRCGTPTLSADNDKARACPRCDLMAYPRISPCVLVAIHKDQQILLARSPHFRPELYSVLAGFIEAGESAEECAMREVYEEVGLHIGPLDYFGSQPWPFPNQLMLAYSAPYLSGTLNLDPIEIEDAGWFSPDQLPQLAEPHTLSNQLIQHVIKTKL